MAIEITIPRLGWSMDEATFVEWLKADGETIVAGDAIFSLESEKAIQDVESIDAGILRILPGGPQKGDTVAVGTLVAFLVEAGEEIPAKPRLPQVEAATNPSPSNAASQLTPAASPSVRRLARELKVRLQDLPIEGRITERDVRAAAQHVPGSSVKTVISPRAKRLARQLGIDSSQLKGSGRSGRIRERDVQAAASTTAAPVSKVRSHIDPTRRVIAQRMMASVQTTAPVTLTTRVDATALVQLRQSYKLREEPIIPTYQDIIAILTAKTLVEHRVMNRQWTEQGINDPEGIHLGLAVDTMTGLVVPVVHDADRLGLIEFAAESARLISRARSRACRFEDLDGGTFTITNLGAFGIDSFTPIINAPQTAILGIGRIRREPVVTEENRIVPRDQLTLSLTFDHRVVDGAPAARFLQQLCSEIAQSHRGGTPDRHC